MASPPPHPQPLSPSLSDNTRSTCSTSTKHAPQADLSQKTLQDENNRPSSPVGMTLAEEMVRSGEPFRRQGKSFLPGSLGETDGAITLAGFVGEDAMEIDIIIDDERSPTSDSGGSMEPLASTDIVSSHARVYEPVVPDSGTASRTGEHATQHVSIPQNVSAAAAQCRPLVKGSHTLRERRMTYLRNMYAMLDQPEPDVPRAILRATSAVRRTKWEIEAGVVGKHPRRKQPAFVAQYRGSSDALLHRQRQLIFEEVHKKRGGSLRSLLNYKHPEVPQSVGEEPSNWNNVHRMEVEEMMRGANLDASDLDEADMDGVVSAVMSAATEAARLATASF